MKVFDYNLFDIVELKKPHPCNHQSKQFQIVRLGADIKIMCLGCGNVILIDRDKFNRAIRKIIAHKNEIEKIDK